MPFSRNKMKNFVGERGWVAALEYGLFAVLITAVVVVTLTGMGADLGTVYKNIKTGMSLPPSGSKPALPLATPAINNAVASETCPAR